MTRNVIIVSVLAAILAGAGGVAAIISASGRGKRTESLNASIVELRKDLNTAQVMQQELTQEKAALNTAIRTAMETAKGLESDCEEARVHMERQSTMYGNYISLLAEENQHMRNILAIVAARGIPVAVIPEVTAHSRLELLRERNLRLKAEIDKLKARGVLLPTTAPKGIEIEP
jgi:chromosome segregation ATPase